MLLDKDDMLTDIGYVPGSSIKILDRQSEGWRHIKAD
jgi:intracellular sulfur oxidation DsrE/DsrF family protein